MKKNVFEEERRLSDGRRKITLRKVERKELRRRQLCEAAAALFLDLEDHRTWQEIAEELGITVSQLKTLTNSEQFERVYNELFADLGHDPRYRAAQAQVSDLLPLAVKSHRDILSREGVADGVRLRAVQEVYKLNNLKGAQGDQSDREALARFLLENELSEPKISVPEEYSEAEGKYLPDVVEGEYEERG
jgi:hypothetical protein